MRHHKGQKLLTLNALSLTIGTSYGQPQSSRVCPFSVQPRHCPFGRISAKRNQHSDFRTRVAVDNSSSPIIAVLRIETEACATLEHADNGSTPLSCYTDRTFRFSSNVRRQVRRPF